MNKRYFLENLFKQWSLNVFKVWKVLWSVCCDSCFFCANTWNVWNQCVWFLLQKCFLKIKELAVKCSGRDTVNLFFTYYKIKCRIWRWNSAAKIFPLSCMVELSVSQNVTFTNQVICNDVSIIFIFKFCMFVF